MKKLRQREVTWSKKSFAHDCRAIKQSSQDLNPDSLTPEPMSLTFTPCCVPLLSFIGNKPPSLLPLPKNLTTYQFLLMLWEAQPPPSPSYTSWHITNQDGLSGASGLPPSQPKSLFWTLDLSQCPWRPAQNPSSDGVCWIKEISLPHLGIPLSLGSLSNRSHSIYGHWMLTAKGLWPWRGSHFPAETPPDRWDWLLHFTLTWAPDPCSAQIWLLLGSGRYVWAQCQFPAFLLCSGETLILSLLICETQLLLSIPASLADFFSWSEV